MKVRFRGVRGSVAVSGPEYARTGGNTTCVEVTHDGYHLILDGGTGLRTAGAEIGFKPVELTVLFSHYHWDHIQGVSMLSEVWAGACLFTFHGPDDPEPMLTQSITPPWFPVALEDAPEPVAFRSLDGPVVQAGFTVTSFAVQHPQGGVGYRIDGPNRSLAIVTDHESAPDCDDVIAEAIDGVDVLIHDSQYLPSEVESHVGWGHSTWVNAATMANRIGATELVLTSHEPSRTDSDIDEMIGDACADFPDVVAASPGMEILL